MQEKILLYCYINSSLENFTLSNRTSKSGRIIHKPNEMKYKQSRPRRRQLIILSQTLSRRVFLFSCVNTIYKRKEKKKKKHETLQKMMTIFRKEKGN